MARPEGLIPRIKDKLRQKNSELNVVDQNSTYQPFSESHKAIMAGKEIPVTPAQFEPGPPGAYGAPTYRQRSGRKIGRR